MIVIVNANTDNKIELTAEELKKYLEEARQEGYDEGYRVGSANVIRYPVYIEDNWKNKNWWDYGTTWSADTKGTVCVEDIKTDPITTAKD